MANDLSNVVADIVRAATGEAVRQGKALVSFAVKKIRELANTVADIARTAAAGKIKFSTAKLLLAQSKKHVIGFVAALQALTEAAVRKIVMAGLNAVKAAVNAFAGVALL